MPKPKPTEIIRHEIVLGRSEKEMIDSALSAYKFNKVADPVIKAGSDISFMFVLAGILTTFFPKIAVSATMTTTEEIVRAILAGIKEAVEENQADILDVVDPTIPNPLAATGFLFPLSGDLTALINALLEGDI